MSKHFTYRSYNSSFKTIPDVMKHMEELQDELGGTDLHNLQYFNKTYFIITKNVYQLNENNYFQHKQLLRDLDIIFARYYFDALKQYTDNKHTTPAWEVAFNFCKQNTSIPLIYVAVGVNAHVNNDLGLSLFDVMDQEDFRADYDKVNKIIFDSLDEVIKEIGLHPFYKLYMNVLIIHWRKNAWNNYLGLVKEKKTISSIEDNAERIAKELAMITSKRDFYRIYRVI